MASGITDDPYYKVPDYPPPVRKVSPDYVVTDMVNHPPHYADGKYECLDVAESLGIDKDGYLLNAFKYIWRCGKKDPNKVREDLEKAVFYLNRRLGTMEKE
jgi:hypothetical protein